MPLARADTLQRHTSTYRPPRETLRDKLKPNRSDIPTFNNDVIGAVRPHGDKLRITRSYPFAKPSAWTSFGSLSFWAAVAEADKYWCLEGQERA